jgi:hypothetical protein
VSHDKTPERVDSDDKDIRAYFQNFGEEYFLE